MSRVLIVEDNALSRALVRTLLEHHGHAVEEAVSMDSARTALSSQPFDLVVMDIQFPGGGGEALLKELRAETREPELPILAVTALAMSGDRERLLSEGFDGYVSKPLDTRGFMREVERLLQQGKEAP